jgi:hypothetical protein
MLLYLQLANKYKISLIISPILYYGPYISSSRTTRKRYKQTSSRSVGGTRTSRTIGRGVAELHDVTRPVRNVGT